MKEFKRNGGKFCSIKCHREYRSSLPRKPVIPNQHCRYCGVGVYKRKSKISKTGLYFCCREHKDLAQKSSSGIEEMRPFSYIDGRRIDYRKLVVLTQCDRCGYDDVKDILVVHHKDRNRSNNRMGNLEVLCPNCHDTEHFYNNDGRFHCRAVNIRV